MENKICVDHMGNVFQSETQMLKHYNIAKTTYHRKIKNGMSQDEILKKWSRKNTICYDHLGNSFKSQNDMLKHYNISWTTFNYGITHGKTIEEILTKNRHKHIDPNGRQFKTFAEMCKYWNIAPNSVKRRLKDGWNLEKALKEPQHRFLSFPKLLKNPVVQKHLTIKKHIDNNYFLCDIDNYEIIMSRWAIIDYAKSIVQNEREDHNGME